jgi:long-chain acyl-CoA synthetase
MYHYDKPDNLVELIERSVARYPNHKMFGTKTANGDYHWVSYRKIGSRIDNLRGGLALLGIGNGDAVGIIADNRVEWAVAAFATYGLEGRFIPMYEKELAKTWHYIINDGDIKVLLVATREIYEQIQKLSSQMSGLENVFLIDGEGQDCMAELERQGQARPVPSTHPDPADIAVLIYTSGTTGNPKGVLLSHGNLTSNVHAGSRLFPQLDDTSRSLSILPWAHSYGQTAELYTFLMLGASIGFIEKVTTVAEDMEKVKPTFLIAVPRVFNKIYDGIWSKMDATGGLAKKIFLMGVESAKYRRAQEAKAKTSLLKTLKFKLLDALVFKKIRARFGGRLAGALTASATMNVEISNFFADIGIPVYDCYGLTETSPAVTMNCPSAHKPGSVGRPIDQVKVVVDSSVVEEGAKDGEIIVYGPNVMQGYHKNPEAHREVRTDDGGFRTGDRGWLDEDGYLFITGRIKEQYKLANGKYVFPAVLEEEIRLVPGVENAFIYGEGKAYNICIVVPDSTVLEKFPREQHLPRDPAGRIQSDEMITQLGRAITDFLTGKFGSYEIPKKFILTNENFSIENGTLTQTMKLKRRAVIARYQNEIDALYA